MLILTRREDERVVVGGDCTLNVVQLKRREKMALISIEFGDYHDEIWMGEDPNIAKLVIPTHDCIVTVMSMSGNQVSLGFKAPRTVKILREELIQDEDQS